MRFRAFPAKIRQFSGESFPVLLHNPKSAFFSWLSRVKSRPSLFNSQFIHKIKIYFPYTNLLYFLERRDFSVGKFSKKRHLYPLYVPDITDAEINEEVDTLRSGWLAKGPKTLEFEKRFAAYLGASTQWP